jgi:hypothetical protein
VSNIQHLIPCNGDGNPIDDAHVGRVSDGFHTFDELYHHRYALFCMMARLANYADGDRKFKGFKSWKHHDGEAPFGEEWFIAGLELPEGWITYHMPASWWAKVHLPHHDRAPEWDGHTAADVVDRMEQWLKSVPHA